MKYLKNFYLIPWTLWCIVSFAVIGVVMTTFIVILLTINTKDAVRWAHHIPTWIGRWTLFLWGVRVEVKNQQFVEVSKQYIFVGNHRSMLDALLSAGLIRNYKKFIGKAELLQWPIVGYVLKNMYIPVKRENKESRKWSMEQLFEKVQDKNVSMVMFSEGTCNTTHNVLLPFKDGAYHLSCATTIPILPFVIYGADQVWHRDLWLIRPGKVFLEFLKPVMPYENTEEGIQSMKQEVYRQIEMKYISYW